VSVLLFIVDNLNAAINMHLFIFYLFILLERAEKDIRFSMVNGTFKTKMDIDRHGPRLMPNNCKNLNPPYFSLPSTFKGAQA
jgi:hypothetical protein